MPNTIALHQKARFIGATRFRRKAYGNNHPLAIPRVSLAFDLIKAYGALSDAEYLAARQAEDEELAGFHSTDYLAALKRAEARGGVTEDERIRYRIGTAENPYFESLYSAAATVAGAGIQAAQQVLQGRVAFNPAGGMHHARRASAAGFCYFNDVVLAIEELRRTGLRVLYVDLDAHHGDAVEEAFYTQADVFTLSLHMDTTYAYPFRGGALLRDCGTPQSAFTTLNLPLPEGTHDAEYRLLFDSVWQPVIDKFRPEVVVVQAGIDGLEADPLGKLMLSTQGWLAVIASIMASAPYHADGTPRLLVTGGGGYNPLLLARAWCGLWGLLSGRELPAAIPPEGSALLRAVGWEQDEPAVDLCTRLDAVQSLPVRDEILRLAKRAVQHPFLNS
ncbi:MAG: acetoin utilization protein AcuC [Burkholderiales bacterium]